ncbi:NifB/NifX family molybdenum-iron cluster-binding protein [Candidatus Lokiarchaeum ossiferum]|uniref:NifB/NifX family molybdenum-iron cluster-binding protein n=1 Tax=Candidatus Lokiarchaeum ossiferum TaxID=2951803 RepID=UPI00352F4256
MENQIIAIPSQMPGGLDAQVDTRFGRCRVFTIVNIVNNAIGTVKIVQNGGNNAMGGAGPVAAQTIAQEKAKCVIGGNYGPNAANALSQAGIATYGTKNGTVKEIIDLFLANSLPLISGSNVGSHNGMN